MDDRIRRMLKDLGNAINESVSASPEVNEQIQRLRDEGYDLYVVLDATIGLGRNGEEMTAVSFGDDAKVEEIVPAATQHVQFRINVNDLAWLKALGIDPTRKVRIPKRIAAAKAALGAAPDAGEAMPDGQA